MACKNVFDHRLVDDEASLEDALPELKRAAQSNALLAVDCEGVSLSRKGALTIITVATEEKAYIFDVLKLGRAVFSGGLGEILADKSREKLMFDCREDSDALWHQFNVKLSGVLDLQLLEIIYRRQNAATRQVSTRNKRRSQRTDEVERISGFRRCLQLYVKDEELIKMKEKGTEAFQRTGKEAWKKRPLSAEFIQYCIVDTIGMFKLYEKMKNVSGEEKVRLRVASDRYVDFYHNRVDRTFDGYEMNSFLPLDIIPEKGSVNFPPADTTCTRCHRQFPREEFSANQMRKREQKCRVCNEIKRREDKERNRREREEED